MSAVQSLAGLDPADDHPHQSPGVPRWTENIQWNVVSADGVGVIWHAGTTLADPTMWHVVVAVTLPDGEVLAGKIVARGAQGAFGPNVACLTTVEPFQRWTFSYEAGMRAVTDADRATGLLSDETHVPVEIKLDLRAAHPPWVPMGSGKHLDWGQFHHEQAVLATGTITVDGQDHHLDGVGHRDHSIGPRDMLRVRRAFWGNGIFHSGWAFATMWGEYDDSEFERAAVFTEAGERHATLTEWSRIDDTLGHPFDFECVMNVDGDNLRITGRCRTGMNFTVLDGAEFGLGTDVGSSNRYVLTCLFVDWECNGERGLGYVDRGALIRLLGAPT